VVLSTRRVTVLLMAVVVMALGIIGVLGAVSSASPDNDNGRNTLTVLTKPPQEIKFVDLDPQGVSHGDMRVVNAPLYDESGKKRIGRVDLFCVTTDPADESAEKVHMAECNRTHTLPGGEISTQGVNAFPKVSALSPNSALPPKVVDAITGGTGRYAGVGGEARIQTRENKVIITFRFVG
jgi:hypothetical protein